MPIYAFDTIRNIGISVLNVNAKCTIGGVMEYKWRISISMLMIHSDFERYFGTWKITHMCFYFVLNVTFTNVFDTMKVS